MVGILLVAHNELGNSLVDCVRHVLGEVPHNLKVLTVLAGDDPQLKLVEGQALIKQLDAGSGVLILADIFGATPSNLPMLLRVVCCPNKTMPELADIAVTGGRECIVHMDSEGCDAATRCANR